MDLVFYKGTLDDTVRFVDFLAEVKKTVVRQDWFYMDPPDLIRKMMEDGTMELWLAMDGDRLAASFDILYPGIESYNYGYDLGLTEDELRLVIHMDTSAVHPDYRGLGLQRRMIANAEMELSGQGRRILLSTVHPDNLYSLNNLLRQGYEIQKRMQKYGSERYILRKEIF